MARSLAKCYCFCWEEGSHSSEIASCEARPLMVHFLHHSIFEGALLLRRSDDLARNPNSQLLITEVK